MSALPKPEKRAKAPKRRPMPKCECSDPHGAHSDYGRGALSCQRCPCMAYRPRVKAVRMPPMRAIARSSAPKRKAMVRCAQCRHWPSDCFCPSGYSPSLAPKPAKRKVMPRKKRKGKRASIARECDRLWSLIVRSRGACEITGKRDGLQGAHGFSRKYRATRWLTINGFALTAGEHWRMTNDPLAWDEYIRKAWGQPVYDELRGLALKNAKQDMPAVLAKLRAEAAARGIE